MAAQWAGIPARTFHRWCRRGKDEESGPYYELWQLILEAERTAEITMVGVVIEAAKGDARHAQWWLERKFPQRWGNNTRELRALAKQIEKLAKTGVPGGGHRKPVAEVGAVADDTDIE